MSKTKILSKEPGACGDYWDMVVERDNVRFKIKVSCCAAQDLGEIAAVERAADEELKNQRDFRIGRIDKIGQY